MKLLDKVMLFLNVCGHLHFTQFHQCSVRWPSKLLDASGAGGEGSSGWEERKRWPSCGCHGEADSADLPLAGWEGGAKKEERKMWPSKSCKRFHLESEASNVPRARG